jgi:D-3-phosphoglycerate dehydrogenase
MRVLIIDPVHEVLMERLSAKGYTIEYVPDITKEAVVNRIGDYEGLILRSKLVVDQKVLEAGGKLRFIGRIGSGMENIDVPLARKKQIQCFNSPEGNRDAVGEHALGLLLSLMNKIPRSDREVRSGKWDREANRGSELKGRTVALIGCGNTGSAFARKISGLEVHTIAFDKYRYGFSNSLIQEKTMEDVFDQADVLSLHVPLTDETRYLVDDAFIRKFRKPFVLINTSRGEVVKTSELIPHLKEGKVQAAGLDVLEYESKTFEKLHSLRDLPPHFSELTALEQVILTPHVAGWTHESYRKLSEVMASKILRHFE